MKNEVIGIIKARTSKACNNIVLSELCDIFWNGTFSGCEHFSISRWLNWFFQKLTAYMSLIAPTDLLSSRECYLISFAPLLCCLVLSIASFWLVGCLEWLCTNVPALLTKQITHECNIEKHEKHWKSVFARRKSVFFPAKTRFFSLKHLYFLRA